MSRFIESIRFENGEFHLLDLHQDRVKRTFASFYATQKPYELREILPSFEGVGKFKFRIVYHSKGYEIESTPYQAKQIKTVKFVEANDLDYSYKYADRTNLNKLVEESGSEETIFVKNGLITDASYANIACFDGKKWWTPEQPLLAGIRRQDLINRGVIFPTAIQPNDLQWFRKVCLINAMLELGELEMPKIRS